MPFQDSGGLRFYQFELLKQASVTQAVFTRRGGVSSGPYSELNVGATVGDERTNVTENLERAFAAVNRPRNSLFDSWLVHATQTLVAADPRPPEWERPPQADIVMTNKPHVTLFMRYADCVPLVFVDPVRKAIALAHAGWRGTLQRVAARTVEQMGEHYGSLAGDLLVGIGPAISVTNYEVGQEVVDEVRSAFGEKTDLLVREIGDTPHLDLAAANRLVLEEAGVRSVENSALCTFDNQADWFSHRASGGKTGRFGALLALGE
jgi:YfiH family protein